LPRHDLCLGIVAAEFVGTSISSGGNGVNAPATLSTLLRENPFVRFHNTHRGYFSCTVTPGQWRSDFRVVENVVTPGAPVATRASFIVEAGRRGIQNA
jgi:alkaline phosphatase D